jgi:hypothetical protein
MWASYLGLSGLRRAQWHRSEGTTASLGPISVMMQESSAEGCIVLINFTHLRSDAIVVSLKGPHLCQRTHFLDDHLRQRPLESTYRYHA